MYIRLHITIYSNIRQVSIKYYSIKEKTDLLVSRLCVGCMSFGDTAMYGYQFYNMQLAKGVTAPIIDATKAKYFDDAVGALDIKLTDKDIEYLNLNFKRV